MSTVLSRLPSVYPQAFAGFDPAELPAPRTWFCAGGLRDELNDEDVDADAYQAALDQAEDDLVQEAIDAGIDPVHARTWVYSEQQKAARIAAA